MGLQTDYGFPALTRDEILAQEIAAELMDREVYRKGETLCQTIAGSVFKYVSMGKSTDHRPSSYDFFDIYNSLSREVPIGTIKRAWWDNENSRWVLVVHTTQFGSGSIILNIYVLDGSGQLIEPVKEYSRVPPTGMVPVVRNPTASYYYYNYNTTSDNSSSARLDSTAPIYVSNNNGDNSGDSGTPNSSIRDPTSTVDADTNSASTFVTGQPLVLW